MRRVYAVVVCDDGSGDLTVEIAEGLGAVVIRHERNLGYGASLNDLFEESRSSRATSSRGWRSNVRAEDN